MTDFEYQCLSALVRAYGATAIIECVDDIATQDNPASFYAVFYDDANAWRGVASWEDGEVIKSTQVLYETEELAVAAAAELSREG